jgi:Mg2+ and Co2+ transporter CorA
LQTVILYNEHEVSQGGNKEDIRRGYNLWIDITDPSPPEILAIQKNFDLDTKTLETFIHKSKKPQVRVLDSYTFTLILDLKYKSFGTLVNGLLYKLWLIIPICYLSHSLPCGFSPRFSISALLG